MCRLEATRRFFLLFLLARSCKDFLDEGDSGRRRIIHAPSRVTADLEGVALLHLELDELLDTLRHFQLVTPCHSLSLVSAAIV